MGIPRMLTLVIYYISMVTSNTKRWAYVVLAELGCLRGTGGGTSLSELLSNRALLKLSFTWKPPWFSCHALRNGACRCSGKTNALLLFQASLSENECAESKDWALPRHRRLFTCVTDEVRSCVGSATYLPLVCCGKVNTSILLTDAWRTGSRGGIGGGAAGGENRSIELAWTGVLSGYAPLTRSLGGMGGGKGDGSKFCITLSLTILRAGAVAGVWGTGEYRDADVFIIRATGSSKLNFDWCVITGGAETRFALGSLGGRGGGFSSLGDGVCTLSVDDSGRFLTDIVSKLIGFVVGVSKSECRFWIGSFLKLLCLRMKLLFSKFFISSFVDVRETCRLAWIPGDLISLSENCRFWKDKFA